MAELSSKNTAKLVVYLVLAIASAGEIDATTIRLYNACPFTIWPAWLSNAGKPQLGPGGIKLNPWQSYDVYALNNWAGRFWGRTGCDLDGYYPRGCDTGDCNRTISCNTPGATPTTLVEYSLHNNNVDNYDVTLVDGYNLPIRVSPSHPGCSIAGCRADINVHCPPELAVRNADGYVMACKSACLAFPAEDRFCCRNQYDNEHCPNNEYAARFKDSCPSAITYKYDRENSSFRCPSGTDYTITFCPSGNAEDGIITLGRREKEDA
ncbi:hypothetical protein SELMODRAFT_418152 [Selaginella moellendorffii]|uniref:Thaumatin-like protein n=1 Tax=Selaginella moellendorffii TaxID=88036 RepID=D8S4U5_SELML|nr:thaumatin-like protein 1b [Selaginella moellendorffii]EFJ20330.1 hypothetical protein SELMODRAFT_418152 [Selaginella moellendorffii]|eukprot:XP_002978344.1 thaumatin-like protein 1b [Selaginella moellendorffii]